MYKIWSPDSGLKVKTQQLRFSGKQMNLDLEINVVRISNLNEIKYLGIYLDKQLLVDVALSGFTRARTRST